ncbi:MAG TPA: tetratricopeptide repeat protein, partial [Candidatus Ozemobacteraceae bacterium]|nr:tetratricopeptide repeat protein [Candidatus Ozemobacteraceae bacterium]
MKVTRLFSVSVGLFFLLLAGVTSGISQTLYSPAVTDLFNRPGSSSPRDLYKMAHEHFTAGKLDDARLLAMRILLDGHRSQNLLDLLGTIEVKAGRPLLAGEWLRKAISLNLEDNVARKVLLRLPPPPRPIPMDQGKLEAHFAQISQKLPLLLERLNSPSLHFDSVLDEIARGQFYKALALAEEYEKKSPGANGTGLTALCALYLGRTRDALQLVEQGLKLDPYHSLLLFVKVLGTDTHPDTSAPNRARALFDQDQWDEALKACDQLTALFPRSGDGLLIKARIAYERRQYGQARSLADQASIRDPDHPGIDLLRSDIALAQNQREQAAQHIERAFRRGYHLPSVTLKAAMLALLSEQSDEAARVLDETEALQPFVDRDAYPLFVEL